MDKRVNIGVLGCANIAKRSLMPAMLNLKDKFNLTGIASRQLSTAEMCAIFFDAQAFDGYQSLIDCPGLQAVYIPLPNSLHAEWIEKSLNRGLHVLVEKSLACDYADVIRLNNLAREKNVALVENFQFRFHNQLQKIKELLDSGIIGELRCIRSSFGFPGLPADSDIRYQKDLGGGALLDTGAYPLKIAQIFLGMDVEVVASNLNYLPEKEVDIWGGAYVKQRNGDLFGELAFGFNHFYQCNIEFWGSKGKIYTNRIFTASPDYKPVLELETADGKELIKLASDNHFEKMLIHFYDLINGKKSKDGEYLQNINQARLINELKSKSK
jgi:predicted dehydrogenase